MRRAPSYGISFLFAQRPGTVRHSSLDAVALTLSFCSATRVFMNMIKTICVYCGSGPGTNPRFVEAAIALGKALAENGIRLVYGGGSIGRMGAIATSVLDHGGAVTGIIPDFLTSREHALTRVQEMIVTPDM